MSFSKDDRRKKRQHSFDFEKKSGDNKSGFFLTARHAGWLASSMLMICFFVFISGYFLGKKKAVEKFYGKIKQDSFADQIYYSMCSMYNEEDEQQEQEQVSDQPDVAALPDVGEQTIRIADAMSEKKPDTGVVVEQPDLVEPPVVSPVEPKSETKYYAELIGFGTRRAAQKFADKLSKNNITVSVKRRRSKNSRGKVITWYQVITEAFNDRSDLIALVDDLSVQERLKDVRIVSC